MELISKQTPKTQKQQVEKDHVETIVLANKYLRFTNNTNPDYESKDNEEEFLKNLSVLQVQQMVEYFRSKNQLLVIANLLPN
jgi:hypothetical protein